MGALFIFIRMKHTWQNAIIFLIANTAALGLLIAIKAGAVFFVTAGRTIQVSLQRTDKDSCSESGCHGLYGIQFQEQTVETDI